jgi:hypothetical protein
MGIEVLMNPPKVETGFVGFFDILGYKSMLETGITDETLKVIEFLKRLPDKVDEAVKKIHFGFENEMLEKARESGKSAPFEQMLRELSRIVPLVVSDSILLRCSYDENHGTEKAGQAATFVVYANVLQRLMFEEGLPLRGAIAFGDFVFVDHVFAGKPIIDAHTLGQSLDLAACAIHQTAEEEFKALIAVAPQLSSSLNDGLELVRYQTPMKNVKRPEVEAKEKLLLLNLAWPTLKGYTPLKDRKDTRSYVEEQFSAHNKQLGPEVVSKVENTEKFLRDLFERFPHLFNRDP